MYFYRNRCRLVLMCFNFCQILKICNRVPNGASWNLHWVQDIWNNWELQLFKACENKSHIYILFPLTSQRKFSLFLDETQVLQASRKRKKIAQLSLIFILSTKNTGLEKLQIILKDTVPKRSSVKRGNSYETLLRYVQ